MKEFPHLLLAGDIVLKGPKPASVWRCRLDLPVGKFLKNEKKTLSTMLRTASTKAVGRTKAAVQQQARRIPETASTGPSQAFRSFATNDKKRALNAQQLKGGAKPEPPKAPEPPPPAVESSSGGPGTTATVLTFLAATSGAMYYNGFLDQYMGDKPKPTTSVVKEKKPEKKMTEKKVEKSPSPKELVLKAAAPEKVTTKKNNTRTKADEKLAKEAKEGVTISKKEIDDFNDIIGDVLGETAVEVEGVQEAVVAIAEEEEKAKAAAAARAAAKADADAKAKALAAAKAKETAARESAAEESVIVMPTAAIATSALDESKILAEIQDLKKQLAERSDGALQEAHTELAKLSSFDVMGLDLDKMTKSQLKVRLVQMARDLEERTKWEAVRLQEFLSMKEKEVEDKYVYSPLCARRQALWPMHGPCMALLRFFVSDSVLITHTFFFARPQRMIWL